MNRLLVVMFCATPSMAFAYFDPGTGAYVVQALFALIVAGLAHIRHPLKALCARRDGLSVCTLLLDLANPGPKLGWRNAEVVPTLQRSRGRFGTVLCVGLIHRLLVTLRTALTNLTDLFADLASEVSPIELVPSNDRKFKYIASPNLHEHLDSAALEIALVPGCTFEERLRGQAMITCSMCCARGTP